jgi:membrane protease YdiL (CAAX protease family)
MSITLLKHTTDMAVRPLRPNVQLYLLVRTTVLFLASDTNTLHIVIQFAYTTVFGFYCCYLFLRSGSLLPPIAAHMFCNIMGIPQPNYEISLMPSRKLCK